MPELYRSGKPSHDTARKGPRAPSKGGPRLDPDVPVPGYYRTRIAKGAADSVIHIWLGPVRCPDDGSERDGPWAFQATRNGTPIAVGDVWPGCGNAPISREEHDKVCERNRTMDPESPYFDVRKPINHATVKPPF